MKKKVFLLLLIGLLTALVCGCKKETKTPVNIAIVSGFHANSPTPNFKAVIPFIEEACKSYGSINIITCDGEPFQVAQVDIPEITKDLSDRKLEEITSGQVQEILNLLTNSQAVTPEVDTLNAIECASRALNTMEGEKWVVILDSGISTTGELNFVGSYFQEIDPQDVTQKLNENNALPDLTNCMVVWYGLADVCTPQQEISSKDRKTLEEVWQTILMQANAASVTFASDLPMTISSSEGLPQVSVVDIMETKAVIKKYNPEEVIVLDDETLNFKAGTAELLTSQNDVKEVLRPVIEFLLDNPEYEILLAGTTASAGTASELKTLSEKRCSTVKEFLLNAGVAESQIHLVGLGFENELTVQDTDSNGKFIEDKGKQNRTVRIMDYNSEVAKELLQGIG